MQLFLLESFAKFLKNYNLYISLYYCAKINTSSCLEMFCKLLPPATLFLLSLLSAPLAYLQSVVSICFIFGPLGVQRQPFFSKVTNAIRHRCVSSNLLPSLVHFYFYCGNLCRAYNPHRIPSTVTPVQRR